MAPASRLLLPSSPAPRAVSARPSPRACCARVATSSRSIATRPTWPRSSAQGALSWLVAHGADYLVNAAGIIRPRPDLRDDAPRTGTTLIAVNAEAVFFLCQVVSARGSAPHGAIEQTSPPPRRTGHPATTEAGAIYAATKAAVISITRSFAYALASRPVRVNAVCPGITDTPMQERVLLEVAAASRDDLRRAGGRDAWRRSRSATPPRPTKCAGFISFLLSDEAGYMTGQALNFSGGLVMT